MSKDDSIFSEDAVKCHRKNLSALPTETIDGEEKKNQKSAKRCAVGFTILYIILFLPFFYMGLLSSMVFDNPRMTVPIGLSIIFLTLLISLSMPVSIYLMWSRYLRGEYRKTLIFCALPIFTFIGVSLLTEVLGGLLRYFVPI